MQVNPVFADHLSDFSDESDMNGLSQNSYQIGGLCHNGYQIQDLSDDSDMNGLSQNSFKIDGLGHNGYQMQDVADEPCNSFNVYSSACSSDEMSPELEKYLNSLACSNDQMFPEFAARACANPAIGLDYDKVFDPLCLSGRLDTQGPDA